MKSFKKWVFLAAVGICLAGCGNEKETAKQEEAEIVSEETSEPALSEAAESMSGSETELIGNEMDYYMSILRNADSQPESGDYVLYDLDKDGIQELIVSSGTFASDWSNDVYTISNQAVAQIGSFGSTVSLYEAEDGNGLFAVYGHMGMEIIYQITKTGSQLNVAVFSKREVPAEEDYYSNDKAIPWISISDIVGSSGEADSAAQSENAVGSLEEYILPDSSTSYLTDAEISSLTADELQMAINEIYARHGRRFQDSQIQAYFDGKSWYSGTIDADSFDESVLSDVELSNIEVLSAYIGGSSAAYASAEGGKQFFRENGGYYTNPDTFQIIRIDVNEYDETYDGQLIVPKAVRQSPDTGVSEYYNLVYNSGNTATIIDAKKGQVLERGTVEFYGDSVYITWDTGYLTGNYAIGMP